MWGGRGRSDFRMSQQRIFPNSRLSRCVTVESFPGFSCGLPHLLRAFCPIPCSRSHLFRALPVFSCRPPCTSPDSLQGPHFVQGNRGSARQKARRTPVSACTSAISLQAAVHFAEILARVRGVARNRGKCTSPCKNKGEVHTAVQE